MPFLVRPEEIHAGQGVLVRIRVRRLCGGLRDPGQGPGRPADQARGQSRTPAIRRRAVRDRSGQRRRSVRRAAPARIRCATARDRRGPRSIAKSVTTLAPLRSSGGSVRFLTDSVTGPAEREAIAAFLSGFRNGRHVTYDPISTSAIADAHLGTHGARIVPRYRFDRAETIVGLGADFLGPVDLADGAHRRLPCGAAHRTGRRALLAPRAVRIADDADRQQRRPAHRRARRSDDTDRCLAGRRVGQPERLAKRRGARCPPARSMLA